MQLNYKATQASKMRKLQTSTFEEKNAMDILSINMIFTESLRLEKT